MGRFNEGLEQTTVRGVRSLMENLSLTAHDALRALAVPEADWAKYLAML